ncbi:MAG: tetratricopeptide repeat protein [Acidobacteria bacterium]|nr:tetratricopeptide repeat protein [Acidobacteriota bacterium]
MGSRRAAVLVAVHGVIALHIAHWLLRGRSVTPVEPSEAMAFAKIGMVNAGLIFFAVAILLTAVFGRFFCGWGCHLVALQDLCRWLLGKIGIRPAPLRSRVLAWVPAVAFVYMFLWPVAYRLAIGDSFRRVGFELTTTELWQTFPGWIIGALTFILCGFVIVYFLGAKGFCTYACPYGAIFGAVDKVSPLRIRVTDACEGCGHCTAVCSSNVRVHEEVRTFGMVVDAGCMKCMDCVSVCPNDALYYGAGPIALGARGKAGAKRPVRSRGGLPGWQEAVLAVGFVAAFLSFRGLYRLVPFLMSLGLAAILAYLVLQAVELVRRPDRAFRGWRLKQGGRFTGRGWVAWGLLVAVAVLWLHSASMRGLLALGDRGLRATGGVQRAALDVTGAPLVIEPEIGERVAATRRHLQALERWGLAATPGNAASLAGLDLVAGDSEALRRHARLALERGEEPARMHQLLARDAWGRGEVDLAVEEYEASLAAAPANASAYVQLGILLGQAGRLDEADAVFERGWKSVPASVEVAYNGGLVRAMLGDTEGAVKRFERALTLDPGMLEARENLAGVLARAGRFDDAVEQYRRALEQSPDDLATRFLLARALVGAGETAAAEAELERILAAEPGQRDALDLLTELRGSSPGGP